jgi:hypothetical protein
LKILQPYKTKSVLKKIFLNVGSLATNKDVAATTQWTIHPWVNFWV